MKGIKRELPCGTDCSRAQRLQSTQTIQPKKIQDNSAFDEFYLNKKTKDMLSLHSRRNSTPKKSVFQQSDIFGSTSRPSTLELTMVNQSQGV